jgi:DNA-binding FadR family transcriptional regulator
LVPGYDLRSGITPTGDSDPAPAATLEQFEMSRSVAREQIVSAVQRLTEARIQGVEIPGSRFRNVHSAIQLRGLVTRRMGLPAYVLAYRYRGRLHRTVISGQDPSCVIGEAPRSLTKLLGVSALILLGIGGVLIGLLKLVR